MRVAMDVAAQGIDLVSCRQKCKDAVTARECYPAPVPGPGEAACRWHTDGLDRAAAASHLLPVTSRSRRTGLEAQRGAVRSPRREPVTAAYRPTGARFSAASAVERAPNDDPRVPDGALDVCHIAPIRRDRGLVLEPGLARHTLDVRGRDLERSASEPTVPERQRCGRDDRCREDSRHANAPELSRPWSLRRRLRPLRRHVRQRRRRGRQQDSLQGLTELGGRGVSVRRYARQCPSNHVVQCRWDGVTQGVQRRRGLRQSPRLDHLRRRARERRLAGQHLVQHAAQGVARGSHTGASRRRGLCW